MHAPLRASEILGSPVTIDGKTERLTDIGIVRAVLSWAATAVLIACVLALAFVTLT